MFPRSLSPLFLLLPFFSLSLSQSQPQNSFHLNPFNPSNHRLRRHFRHRCTNEFRTLNGTCTNRRFDLWGSAGRPHFSYFHGLSSAIPTGQDLPSARYISNTLCKQEMDMPNSHGLTEFFVFFGQFLDHNLALTPTDRSKPMPIAVPVDDPIFANGSELAFHRSVTGVVDGEGSIVRPINTLSSAIDLSAVYGVDSERMRVLRSFSDGKMKMGEGGMLPLNEEGLENAPSGSGGRFFLAGDHRANEHPMLTSFHVLFVREHNRLCDELKEGFPEWDDEQLFEMARMMNGAQFQKMVYEQFLPAILGRVFGRYFGHRGFVDPTVSNVFSTAAFRVGHTMVGNGIHRRAEDGRELEMVGMEEMFFRGAEVMEEGIEVFLRGALGHRAQQVDMKVVNALRNFLFTAVEGEEGFDLVALNLQRGRDHGLPSYNDIREMFGMRRARRFGDITRDRNLQLGLAHVYGSVDRVEAWVGMMAEDHKRGAAVGKLLFRVWKREFMRLRDGDRFYYRRRGLFPLAMWRRVPRLRDIYTERDTMRSVLLRNTEIGEEEVREGELFRNSRL